MNRLILCTFPLALFATGCGPKKASYIDPDASSRVEGTGIEARDFRAVAAQMAEELLESGPISTWAGSAPPRIAVLPVENRTRFLIDEEIFSTLLTDELIQTSQGRLAMVNRDQIARIMEEREMKRRGQVDSARELTSLAGVEFFLEGEVRGLHAANHRAQSDYVVVRFQLTDAESGVIGWSNRYEMKKEGSWGVMYQ